AIVAVSSASWSGVCLSLFRPPADRGTFGRLSWKYAGSGNRPLFHGNVNGTVGSAQVSWSGGRIGHHPYRNACCDSLSAPSSRPIFPNVTLHDSVKPSSIVTVAAPPLQISLPKFS